MNYIELVLLNWVLQTQSPDFSTQKFYILSCAPFRPKANPDYNYLSTQVEPNTNFWDGLGSIINTVLGIFSPKSTNTGPTNNTDISTNTINYITNQQPQIIWLQKNALLVDSVIVIAAVIGIIYTATKKKAK